MAIIGSVFGGLVVLLCVFWFLGNWDHIQRNWEENTRKETIAEIQKANENGDYEKAYQLLGELKGLCQGSYYEEQYKDCRDKVVKSECLYLVSQEDEQSAKRIVYLLSQYFEEDSDRWSLDPDSPRKTSVIRDIYALAKKVNNEYVQDYLKDEYEKLQKNRDENSTEYVDTIEVL